MDSPSEAPPTSGQKRSGRCLALLVAVLVGLPVLSSLLFPSPHAEVLRALRGHDLAQVHSAALSLAADAGRHGAYGEFRQLFAPQPETRPIESLPAALSALAPRGALVGEGQVTLLWDAGTLGGSEFGLVLAAPDQAARLKQGFGAATLRELGPGAWSLVPLR